MAQFVKDFTEYALGASIGSGINDLTLRWNAAVGANNVQTSIIADAISASGRSLTYTASNITGPHVVTLDQIGAINAPSGQVYLVSYATDDNRANWGRTCFSHVSSDGQSFHAGAFFAAGGGTGVAQYAQQYLNGTATQTPSAIVALGTGVANRLRAYLYEWETSGTTVTKRFKSWFLDTAEPASFTISRSDNNFSGIEGFIGFGFPGNPGAGVRITFVGVGTNGDPAPRTSAVSPVAVNFTGTVPTLNGTEGTAFSESVASYFGGTETPFSYSVHAGTLPAGLTLNTSTGVISGTPTSPGTSAGIVIRATDATPNTADTNSFSIVIAAADVTAPILTSPTATATGQTTYSGSVSTDEANGILYWLVNASASATGTEVKAGASQAVSTTGVQNVTGAGLTAGTSYYAHYLHRDTAGNDSTVSTSAQFTTTAADVTAPILTLPTGTATGQTTATGAVNTDEANGTLYAVVTASATPPSAADIRAGTGAVYATSQAVSTTGIQNVAATGLTAATAYYWHFLHDDAAANPSAIATSASFTTDAVPSIGWTVNPAVASVTTNSITVSATPNMACDVFAVALRKTQTAPTSANVIAGLDGDALAAASASNATYTDTAVSITLTGLTADPIYDVYVVAHIPE